MRGLVGDVHHFHLANVVLALNLGDGSDVRKAIEVSGLGDRTPEETEMPVIRCQLVVPFHAGIEILAPEGFLEIVGGDRLECDRRNYAKHADGNLRGGHRFKVPVAVDFQDGPVGLDQPHADRLGRQAAKPDSGAVCAGRKGAGDGLGVDIPLIDERQTDLFQRAADIADPRACAHDHALAIEVGADEPLHVL
jgi:hypothetical protein